MGRSLDRHWVQADPTTSLLLSPLWLSDSVLRSLDLFLGCLSFSRLFSKSFSCTASVFSWFYKNLSLWVSEMLASCGRRAQIRFQIRASVFVQTEECDTMNAFKS